MRYLSLAEDLWLAEQVTGIEAAVLSKAARIDLADSALHASSPSFGGQAFHPDVIDKAAVLTCRLAWNRSLPDGNKRAAWAALVVSLDLNEIDWSPDPPDVEGTEQAMLIAGPSTNGWRFALWQAGAPKRSSRFNLTHFHVCLQQTDMTRLSGASYPLSVVTAVDRACASPARRSACRRGRLRRSPGDPTPTRSPSVVRRRRRRVRGGRPAPILRSLSVRRASKASTISRLRTASAAAKKSVGPTRPISRHQPFAMSIVAGSLIRALERSTPVRRA